MGARITRSPDVRSSIKHRLGGTNMPGMTKEMRHGVVAAFDALSNWSDEIEIVK
jgi:hypothetical protein